MSEQTEKTAADLLQTLSYLKRSIKEFQDKEKAVTEQIKVIIEANGGEPVQSDYYKAAIVPHSYALVANDERVNESKAKATLVEQLLKSKQHEFLNISVDVKTIFEEIQRQNFQMEKLLDSVGLKLEQRHKFDFNRK